MERVILDWLPDYDIAENGEVRRITAPQKGVGINKNVPYLMTQTLDHYYCVRLMLDGKPVKRNVHALVCEAFYGPKPSPDHVVAHSDGNRKNNHATNLRWATQKENLDDTDIHGTRVKGEKVGNSKLKEADIIAIRLRRNNGEIYRTIASDYNVSIANIHTICSGGSWAWL